jgi:hypothetical protein
MRKFYNTCTPKEWLRLWILIIIPLNFTNHVCLVNIQGLSFLQALIEKHSYLT